MAANDSKSTEAGVKQGAARHAISSRKDDLYETPICAIQSLIKHQSLPFRIWEPCAGRGAISRELIKYGHEVIAYDLVSYEGSDLNITTPIDFLMEIQAPEGVNCIVTNPPYKLADDFIRHGLELCNTVIVLLRFMACEGTNRSDIIDNHLYKVWLGKERLPTMHREGWSGNKITNSGAPFGWFVFHSDKKEKPEFTVERISWRA